MAKQKKVQLQDIAIATGVNVSTVSSVLNGRANERRISKELEDKILKTAEELNYKPNVLAQSLRSGKSHILGLILPDISNPAFSMLAHVIEKLASQNNYRLMSCNSGEGDHHPETLINSLINYRVDGLIIVPTTRMKPSLFKMIEDSGIPFVIADRYLPQVPTYQVTLDNFRLGFDPAEHLIRQGLERIAFFITYPTLNNMKDRLAGYKAAMNKYKKQIDPAFIKNIPFENEAARQAVYAAIDDLLALNPPIEGVIFMSNTIGLPALGHLHAKGVKIPENLKIMCEETSIYFSLMHPSISAMNLNLREMSEKLFEFLMKLIRDDDTPSRSVIETIPISIIIRESSTCIH